MTKLKVMNFDIASSALHKEFRKYGKKDNDFSVYAYHRMVKEFAENAEHKLHIHAKYMSDSDWREKTYFANTSPSFKM